MLPSRKNRPAPRRLGIAALLLVLGCSGALAQQAPPLGLPPVPVPESNPLTPAKIALGERLFFEQGLSADRSISCASCHLPTRFFSDDKPLSVGVSGYLGMRNAPPLSNAAYASHLMWDGRATTLEDQIRYPLMHPREMRNSPARAVGYLAADPVYRQMFKDAFGDGEIVWDQVAKAIASYERTLLSGNSAFDRYMAGDQTALSPPARHGYELFNGAAGCSACHLYSKESPFFSDFDFHNTGLSWAASPDLGRYEISKVREDKGAFRTPMLRNVGRTGPYMHDGRIASLPEVVEFYSRGGEDNPFLDARIHPLDLSAPDRADLVAFLESLTSQSGEAQRTPADTAASAATASRDGPPPSSPMPKVFAPFTRAEVVTGGGDGGDRGKAIDAMFVGIGGVAVDPQHNVYLADTGSNRIRRIDARSGIISTVAGNGFLFDSPGSPSAVSTALRGPAPIALDREGRRLFVGEIIGRRVQQVDLVGGQIMDLGAPRGGFGEPTGLAWTEAGLLVADPPRGQIWRLQQSGGWVGLLPDELRLRGGIRSLVADLQGRIYVAEYFAHRVLRWDPASGQFEVAAGTGEPGRAADGAEGPHSPLRSPDGIALDREGNLLIADKSNHRLVRVDVANGRLTTLVEAGGQGTDERWTPGSFAVDPDGIVWIGDIHRSRLLRYDPTAGQPVVVAGAGQLRDSEPALSAPLAQPGAVISDADGNVYVSDTLHHRVRMVERGTGLIHTVAGTGVPGYNGDGMPATEAWLGYPGKLGIDPRGRLYIGDYYNNRVRRVDPRTGFITTVAGSGRAGEYGDGGPAHLAMLLNPHALAFDSDRLLIIASAVSPRIRTVDLRNGVIDTLPMDDAAPQTLVFYGLARWKGGLALASPRPGSVVFLKDGKMTPLFASPDVVFPQDVAVAPNGDLYICETGRNRIMRWDGSRLQVVVEDLGRPRSIGFDPHGNLLIAETFHNRVLRIVAESIPPPR
jgi:cytochrome c peroxidase